MQKRSATAQKGVLGDMRPLLLALVHDLYADLPDPDRLISLIAREDSRGSVVRAYVSAMLSDAECSLHSLSTRQYAAIRQVSAFLSKNVSFSDSTAESRRSAALVKFKAAERRCLLVNKKILHYSKHWSRMSPSMLEVFTHARQEIFKLLGEFSPDSLEACLSECDFGPGLTFGSSSRDSTDLYFKVGGEPLTVTPEASVWLPALVELFPHWFQLGAEVGVEIREVPGNRVTVVPKTAVIDRTIAIEPSFNVFLQKGTDVVLQRLLQKWGVTVRDQSRNYLPARIGSVNGYFSTIDLSSASDCVSLELVRWLLPPGWFQFLDSLRSSVFTMDKGRTWEIYSKFSSMGNATTFPLESLIFAAISRACAVYSGFHLREVRVYGDDIILPGGAALLCIEALKFAGFSTNTDKTFVFGNFRESCGRDYLSGVDVRPVYLRSYPKTEQQVYNLFNRLRVNRVGFSLDNTLRYLWGLVKSPCLAPSHFMAGTEWDRWYAGKSTNVDIGFHVPVSVVWRFGSHSPSLHTRVYRVRTIKSRLRDCRGSWDERLRYLTFLLGSKGGEVQLQSTRVFFRSWQSYSSWPEDGHWPDWIHGLSSSP